ncbi:MAG: hypothetical protein GY805_28610 [Chloroflexi bacterium]|nr:hypothetical protein [Chloroflexota bacterium]
MGVLRANALGIFLSIGSVITSVVITALLDLTTETAVLLIGGLMIILVSYFSLWGLLNSL